ncbi:MAG TPA: hypothetical protein DCS93_00470 [Microscillaceae bacterium]|nr:hypothetical protein [Microscillaceae bacterium]
MIIKAFEKYLYLTLLSLLFWGLLTSCDSTKKSDKRNPPPTTTSFPSPQQAVVTASSGLVLRQSPQAFFDSAYLVPYNVIVDVLAQTNEIETHQATMGKWYKVAYGQQTGYIFGGYLEVGTRLTLPKIYPVIEKIFDTDLHQVKQRALVNTNTGLVLRQQPTTSSTSITIIAPQEEVAVLAILKNTDTIEARRGSWCKVRFRQHEGYIFSGFLTFTKARIKAENGSKMRKKPSIDGQMELFIPKDRVVFLLSDEPIRQGFIGQTSGFWYKVAYQRKQGYVFSPDLEIKGY